MLKDDNAMSNPWQFTETSSLSNKNDFSLDSSIMCTYSSCSLTHLFKKEEGKMHHFYFI